MSKDPFRWKSSPLPWKGYLVLSLHGYALGLMAWFLAFCISGDHYSFLSLVNMFAVYLFLAQPLVLIGAVIARSRWLCVEGIALLLIFGMLWGRYFVPKSAEGGNAPVLRVLTYNVLGYNQGVSPQAETIRTMDADVVFLQELNVELGDILQTQLAEIYPYQILNPEVGVNGMGVLSKYPLRVAGDVPDLGWVGDPQWLVLEWQGCEIGLINFHMAPTNSFASRHVNDTNARRQQQARWLTAHIDPSTPVILAGDTNSAPLSDAYRLLSAVLQDAWVEAGWGLGHTFPGRSGEGSSRPTVMGIPVPMWLIRIDDIFYTRSFSAVQARLAPFDGVSDHRGVFAALRLNERCAVPGAESGSTLLPPLFRLPEYAVLNCRRFTAR
jgi:vancomycin resistance protein VanJ